MIKTVKIRNFRGFRSADLSECSAVNVVVGANGSGKTALLEALFFAAGNSAEIAMRVRQWRGFEATQAIGTSTEVDESLWADLFHNFQRTAKLSIDLSGDREHERQLKISFLPRQNVLVPLRGRRTGGYSDAPTVESTLETAGVSFDWKGPYKQHIVSVGRLQEGKLSFSNTADSPFPTAFFFAGQPASMVETVGRFSALSKKGEARDAVQAFTQQFPAIADLSIEVLAGAPMLYASVENQLQKVPVNILSAGMSRLSSLLVAIPNLKGGVLLIDEIENGFYYKKLPSLWQALYAFCAKYNVQLFASTHSAECLAAASQLAKEHIDDFSLIRAESSKGACSLRQFTGSQFSDAIDADVEIR